MAPYRAVVYLDRLGWSIAEAGGEKGSLRTSTSSALTAMVVVCVPFGYGHHYVIRLPVAENSLDRPGQS